MNILRNKYFIFGNIALILVAIPLTLFFLKRQQDLGSRATPTTTLSFNPTSLQTDQCTDTTTNLVMNPGNNIVSTVEVVLTWDATKFTMEIAPNSTAFPQVLKGPTISNGTATVTLNIGADVTKAITAPTTVATVTIKPISSTGGSPARVEIDSTKTKILSLAESDEATENVYSAAGSTPLQIAIAAKVCESGEANPTATPTPIGRGGTSPTATPTPTGSSVPTPTTAANNVSPSCLSINASPAASGSAPFALTLTASGRDTDGTISKATFNFGDGTVQDSTTGMGIASVAAQLAHTYTVGGNYSASVTFTDNRAGISTACSKQIAVTGNAPTSTPTPTTVDSGQATTIPTATPTIESPGGIITTISIVGGIALVILAGILLLAL